jgi:DNA-binding NarL/FixJ family response regulator
MDLQMPEMTGLDAIIAIREEAPEARIIVLTTYSGDVQVVRALKAGARAFLLRDLLHKELLAAIRTVHAGRKHLYEDPLTSRELDVLRLIAAGHANKEIAAQLSIVEGTVKSRVKNIPAKLHAKDRTHAATIGLKRGIIQFNSRKSCWRGEGPSSGFYVCKSLS